MMRVAFQIATSSQGILWGCAFWTSFLVKLWFNSCTFLWGRPRGQLAVGCHSSVYVIGWRINCKCVDSTIQQFWRISKLKKSINKNFIDFFKKSQRCRNGWMKLFAKKAHIHVQGMYHWLTMCTNKETNSNINRITKYYAWTSSHPVLTQWSTWTMRWFKSNTPIKQTDTQRSQEQTDSTYRHRQTGQLHTLHLMYIRIFLCTIS